MVVTAIVSGKHAPRIRYNTIHTHTIRTRMYKTRNVYIDR